MNNIVNFSFENELLFGKDPEENIVGAYQLNDSQIRLFSEKRMLSPIEMSHSIHSFFSQTMNCLKVLSPLTKKNSG